MGRFLLHLRSVRRLALSCGVYAVLTTYFAVAFAVWLDSLGARDRWKDQPYSGGRALARAASMGLSALFVALPLWAFLREFPAPSRIGVLVTLMRMGWLPRLIVPAGTGLTALCAYCTVMAWRRRYWGVVQRVHLTVQVLASSVMVLWWSDIRLARLLA
jgi:hypothetical protein